MAFDATVGNALADAMSTGRGMLGETFGIGGKLYPATITSLDPGAVTDLADGLGINAANADFHRVNYSPGARSTDGATTVPNINETTEITLTAKGPEIYRVGDFEHPQVGTVGHTAILTVYRKAAADASTVAPAGETNAGQVKNYDRPQNSL